MKVPKITRDRMPFIWASHGDTVKYEFIEGADKVRALHEKLVEEATEVREAKTREELVKEYADVWEVFIASIHENGVSMGEVLEEASHKRADRGGFSDGVYLTEFQWGPGGGR